MNIIEMQNITKNYPPKVTALDAVTFNLKKGVIHSLLGENGAGKSTLMKVLYGLETPDTGEIKINGKIVQMKSSLDAIANGIGMVHQHFMLADVLTVTENIVVNAEPTKFRFDYNLSRKKVDELIKAFKFNLDPDAKVADLSVGEQQRVEILKLMYRQADILILDEPTAVLTPNETKELFVILKKLKEAGKTIILITHKLHETLEVADEISVLRKGKMIDNGIPLGNITKNDLALMMVGRGVELSIKSRSKSIGDIGYSVKNLKLSRHGKAVLEDISFDLRKGQILGIAGVEGNGQTDLIKCLTGIIPADSGEVMIGDTLLHGSVEKHIQMGVGHIPEDRNQRGLVNPFKIMENLILGYHRKKEYQNYGVFHWNKVKKYSEDLIQMYDIRTPSGDETAGSLSGGNQQKVVVARVFEQNPKVVVVAQPTRGIDVGAMEYIHRRILELRDAGTLILLISSDLDELRNLSDYLMVIFEGKIVSRGETDTYDDTTLSSLMNSGVA